MSPINPIKVGDHVEAIRNGVDYGEVVSVRYASLHDYQTGDIGVVANVRESFINPIAVVLDIKFDNGKYIIGCSGSSFKIIGLTRNGKKIKKEDQHETK